MSRTPRHAPPVRYPLQRSRTLGILLIAVGALGGAAMAGWLIAGSGPAMRSSVGFASALWVGGMCCALHFWRAQLCGALCWDGQHWAVEHSRQRLAPVQLGGSPEVLLDVQSHLWLRLEVPGHRPYWVWVQRSFRPELWMDMRRAVYSRAEPGVDHADESAPASSGGA